MQGVLKDSFLIQKLLALIAAEKTNAIEDTQTEMEQVGRIYVNNKLNTLIRTFFSCHCKSEWFGVLHDSFFMHLVVSIKHIRLENLFQHEGQVL